MMRKLQPITTSPRVTALAIVVAIVVHIILWSVVSHIGITQVETPVRTKFMAVMLKPGETINQHFNQAPTTEAADFVSVQVKPEPKPEPIKPKAPEPTKTKPPVTAVPKASKPDATPVSTPVKAASTPSKLTPAPKPTPHVPTHKASSSTPVNMTTNKPTTPPPPRTSQQPSTPNKPDTPSQPLSKADMSDLTKEMTESQLKKELNAAPTSSKANSSTATTPLIPMAANSSISDEVEAELVTQFDKKLHSNIYAKWVLPANIDITASLVKARISLAPTGEVLAVVLISSSGSATVDASIITAIKKASPLPVPNDAAIFDKKFKSIVVTFNPQLKK